MQEEESYQEVGKNEEKARPLGRHAAKFPIYVNPTFSRQRQQLTTTKEQVHAIGLKSCVPPMPNDKVWIVDCGATDHITPNYNLLANIRRLNDPKVFGTLSGLDRDLMACEQGDLKIPLKNNALSIRDVYYVPNATANILSVHRMVKNGWMVNLKEKGGTIAKGKTSIHIKSVGGLWALELPNQNHQIMLSTPMTPAKTALQNEHERLGHLGRKKLLSMAKDNLLRMSFSEASSDSFRTDHCSVCQQQKIPRKPKNNSSPSGTRAGELVHCDISGPFIPSKSGNDYLVSMLDDYSKICAIKPMIGKNTAFEKLCEFVITLERQVDSRVRFIRTDNGGEFTSGQADEWYRRTGIIHQISTPYTPELNGTVERFMRTSKEMMSTMIAEGELGHDYWDFAAKYTSTILMKTSQSVDGINAWQRFTGRKPNINSIMKFGTPVFVHILKETRRKASFQQEKATTAKILGQDESSSGWIVKLDVDDKITRSRDVQLASGITLQAKEKKKAQPQISQEEEEIMNSLPVRNVEDSWSELPGLEIEANDLVSAPLVQPGGESMGSLKPSWYYEEIDDTESIQTPQGPTATFEEGVRRNAPRAARRQPHTFHAYSGMNARNAHLASEASVLLTAFDRNEPNTIEEALSCQDKTEWYKAIYNELQNLNGKKTWELTKAPKNRKIIGCRWVFKLKRDAEGKIQKYKARLVAKGFSQVPGVDFEETYAPVGRTTSLRIFLAIAATQDLEIIQVDVEGAYLNGNLEEEIYMELPSPLTKTEQADCVRLKKSLYV